MEITGLTHVNLPLVPFPFSHFPYSLPLPFSHLVPVKYLFCSRARNKIGVPQYGCNSKNKCLGTAWNTSHSHFFMRSLNCMTLLLTHIVSCHMPNCTVFSEVLEIHSFIIKGFIIKNTLKKCCFIYLPLQSITHMCGCFQPHALLTQPLKLLLCSPPHLC